MGTIKASTPNHFTLMASARYWRRQELNLQIPGYEPGGIPFPYAATVGGVVGHTTSDISAAAANDRSFTTNGMLVFLHQTFPRLIAPAVDLAPWGAARLWSQRLTLPGSQPSMPGCPSPHHGLACKAYDHSYRSGSWYRRRYNWDWFRRPRPNEGGFKRKR